MSDLEKRVERLESELGIESEESYKDIAENWARISNGRWDVYTPARELELVSNDGGDWPFRVAFNQSVVSDDEMELNREMLWVKVIERVKASEVPDDYTLRTGGGDDE